MVGPAPRLACSKQIRPLGQLVGAVHCSLRPRKRARESRNRAEEDVLIMIGRQSVPPDHALAKFVCIPLNVHVPSGAAKTLRIVFAIGPNVIMLTEQARPLISSPSGGFLERLLKVGIDGHLQDRPATRAAYPPKLAHCRDVVGNVLENVMAQNHIKVAIRVRNIGDVKPYHRMRRAEVRSDVFQIRHGSQSSCKAGLRCDVQHAQTLIGEGRLLF